MSVPAKGTVVGRSRCPGCGKEAALTVTKTGKVCLICANIDDRDEEGRLCFTKVFYGGPASARILAKWSGKPAAAEAPAKGGDDGFIF